MTAKLTKAQLKVSSEAEEVVERANGLVISNEKSAEEASNAIRAIKAMVAEAKKVFADPKKKAYEAHQSIVKAEKGIIDPLNRAEKTIKQKVATWMIDRERAAKAEQMRLEAEARRQAQEQAEAEAKAIESVDSATARAIRSTVGGIGGSSVPTVHVEQPAKPAGVSTRTLHRARNYDLIATIMWVAEDPDARAPWLTFNQSHANDVATTTKGGMVVPGVEFYTDTSVAVR